MQRIESHTRTIRQLLANTKYQLDYYQREYSWQAKHVVELLDDLFAKFMESYNDGDAPSAVQGYGHYFLGSIIISHDGPKRYIVDGQQRLTTLTLLFMRLHTLIEEAQLKEQVNQLIHSLTLGKSGFNLEVPEWESVMKALYEEIPFDESGSSESVQNILLRYGDVEAYFRFEDQELASFAYWLLENVYLVEIAAYHSKDAYMIFETVNDRGLSLTPTDMLRGYLLSHITDAEQRNESSKLWDARIRELNKQKNKEEESDAIKAWLRSQYAKTPAEFDRIGSEFHRWVRDEEQNLGLTAGPEFANFIENSFEFYGKWYCHLRDAANTLIPGMECVYYNEQHQFTLQYPILLAPLSVSDSDDVILRKIQIVSRYLDILIHRRIWNFQEIAQRAMITPMFPVMCAIRGAALEELADILYDLLEGQRLTFTTGGQFRLQGNNRRKIHVILARMTDYVAVQSGQLSRYPEYAKRGVNSYDIEYIWANYFDAHSDEFQHEYDFEAYRNRIGGLLLLPRKNNASYRELPYARKREHYLEENLLAQSLHERTYENNPGFRRFVEESGLPFEPHTEFRTKDLDKRQTLYNLLAERIWNPERLKLPDDQEPDSLKFRDGRSAYDLSAHRDRQTKWTAEQVRDIVPPERREYYETEYRNKISEFYMRVAELQNLVRENRWEGILEIKFRQYYSAFYFENKRLFGVSLEGSPRFCVSITETEAERLSNLCRFESYRSGRGYAHYPTHITTDDLLPIFKFAYKKHCNIHV